MSLAQQILIAIAVDILIGDPEWLPHPVRLIGGAARRLEAPLRRAITNERTAGIVMVILICSGSVGAVMAVMEFAFQVHPFFRDVVSIYVMYSCIALRDMMRHSGAVHDALMRGELVEARLKLGRIVGRDTQQLDSPEVVRATVESVAESSVDGVLGPIFFCFIAGPVGAILHKASNTLDSTFGYTTHHYLRFGWASARLDDLLNWIPARLSGIFIALAAPLAGGSASRSFRIFLRDGHKHASPNAGKPEAAFAGALGVRLGGSSDYDGERIEKPEIGDSLHPLIPHFIARANRILLAATLFATAFGTAIAALAAF